MSENPVFCLDNNGFVLVDNFANDTRYNNTHARKPNFIIVAQVYYVITLLCTIILLNLISETRPTEEFRMKVSRVTYAKSNESDESISNEYIIRACSLYFVNRELFFRRHTGNNKIVFGTL